MDAGDKVATDAAATRTADTAPEPDPKKSRVESGLASADSAGPTITFKVTFKGRAHEVTLPQATTVAQLQTRIEEMTEIPPRLQKLMYKGILKDGAKTLVQAGIKSGCKVMLVGSKPKHVETLKQAAGSAAALADDDTGTKKSAEPLCQKPEHKKIIERGLPADATPLASGSAALTSTLPTSISGLVSRDAKKVRLSFKHESGELCINTPEGSRKLPFGRFPGLQEEEIEGHKGYHMIGLKVGSTEKSMIWIYWIPEQYMAPLKELLRGPTAAEGGAEQNLEESMLEEAIRRSLQDP